MGNGICSRQYGPQLALVVLWLMVPALIPNGIEAQALSSEQTHAIDAVFADVDPTEPGCAVGVVSNQELVYSAGYGLANLDYGLPITPQSIFYLGSVGKQFTAAAIVHADRAGHLSLDDPLTKWIPEIPEYDRAITIRHLVHHTSGLRDYLTLLSLSGKRLEDVHTDDELLTLIARQSDTNFPPGDQHLYSNTGYYLLSVIMERASEKSLRDYTQDALLDPLGMTRSRFHDDRLEVMDGRVVGYEATTDGYQLSHPWNFDKVGSGGVYSSVEELANWDRNYYTEEVGGPGFTKQLRERGILTDGTELDYAFGLSHAEYRGLATIGHGGALAGFRSALLRFPEQRTTVLIPCNFQTSNPGQRARQVADIVLADHFPQAAETGGEEAADREPVSLTDAQQDAFTGHWRASMGIEIAIERGDEGLVFIQNGRRTSLVTLADNVLSLPAADIEMTTSGLEDGRFTAMSVVQSGRPFTAVRFDPATETWDYSDTLGRYFSNELDVTYELVEVGDELFLKAPPSRQLKVTNAGDDRLRTAAFSLQLSREDGRVVGFTIDAGRALGIYFERTPLPR